MQQEVSLHEARRSLTLITPTPGRLRRGLLIALGAAFGIWLFAGGIQLAVLAFEEGLLSWLFDFLTSSWVFWTVLASFVLLLVLDSHSRHKLVWGVDTVRASWLFGSIELFVVERRHCDLPALELLPLRANLPVERAEDGPWVLGWRFTDNRGRSDWLMRLAQCPNRQAAEALRDRVLAWTPDPSKPERVRGAAVDELGSAIVGGVLRLPLILLLGACVVGIALTGEAALMQAGRLPPPQPWDAQAEAKVVRFAWRFYTAPREIHTAQGRVMQDQIKVRLQAAVRFVDAQGRTRERPLALLAPVNVHGYRPSFVSEGGPAYPIETLAEAGLVPDALRFEIPHALLPLATDPDGALRTFEAQTEPNADARTPAYEAHWTVLSNIDRPGVHLPVTWTEPSPRSPFTVLYRERDDDDASPVWLPSDLAALEDELIHANGVIYVLGFFAVFVGGICLVILLPSRLHAWVPWLWIAFAASSVLWTGLTPTAAAWLGIDRGLQLRLRDALTQSMLPEAQPLEPLDLSVTSGHWSPQHSRFHRLLNHLDLMQPPAQRLPNLARAQQAIAERALARMQAMSMDERHDLLRGVGTVRLGREGNGWLVKAVLVPGFCRWLAEPDFAPIMREHYPAAVQTVECAQR